MNRPPSSHPSPPVEEKVPAGRLRGKAQVHGLNACFEKHGGCTQMQVRLTEQKNLGRITLFYRGCLRSHWFSAKTATTNGGNNRYGNKPVNLPELKAIGRR